MTAITPRTIIIDGTRLDTYAFAITSRTGWDSLPGLTGENIRVPGRDGEVWSAKDYAPGLMSLDLFVQGTNSAGAIPGGSTAAKTFRANMDALLAIFGKRSGLIAVEKEMEDGTIRRNNAEVTAVVTPDYYGEDSVATLKVLLTLPNPIWSATSSTTSTGTGLLTSFTGITAPITDAIITVTGTTSGTTITDVVSGAWIKYVGALTGTWVINCSTFSSLIGGASAIAGTTFNPGPRFFTITPNSTLTPNVTLSGGGSLSISAAKKFLT